MATRLDAWSAKDRDAFWTFVRGRMAERRLNQEQVAGAIGISRAVLSRRFNGEIKERPTEWMIEQLTTSLRLSTAEHEQLQRWAGYAERAGERVPMARAMVHVETEPASAEDEAADPALTAGPEQHARRTLTPWMLGAAGAVSLLVVALVAVLLTRWLAPVRPGGVWAGPLAIEPNSGRMHITARAYPSTRADPPIAYVEFTASWDGRPGPWLVACRVVSPTHTDLYECHWDPAAVGVPAGPLRVSFDVYDANGNVNLAPHGVRSFTYERSAP